MITIYKILFIFLSPLYLLLLVIEILIRLFFTVISYFLFKNKKPIGTIYMLNLLHTVITFLEKNELK